MSDIQNLKILDELGFPSNPSKILFSSIDNILIYSIGSCLIYYNLNNNTKTFLQLTSSNNIYTLKFIDNYNQILLTIDNYLSPHLNIWDLQSFQNLFNQEISIKNNYGLYFATSHIFVEKVKNDLFIVFISSLTCNDYILYLLYLSDDKYVLEPFSSQINQNSIDKSNSNKIIGFKYFLNSKISVIIYKSSIEYCEFNYNNKTFVSLKNLDFNFNILPNSLSISNDFNLISFISSKGHCLVFDINCVNKSTINPYNQDSFTITYFYQDSLYIGTNTGKVFIYEISNYQLKYYFSYNKIYFIKKKFQINNRKFNDNNNREESDFVGPSIDYLVCDEKNDKIFIKMGDNSILLSPISFIIDNNNGYINDKLKGNTPLLFSYNHSKPITKIEFCEYSNNKNGFENIFYTCSKDHILIKYFINHNDNKLYNQFIDINDILNENNLNEKPKNDYKIYFNVIKFHPKQKNNLYIGDNKGFLYILDINRNNIIYSHFIGETYPIDSLSFNAKGNLICIGYETGMKIIYYINNFNNERKFEKYLLLNKHYISPQEIEFRKSNNHILSFGYFFEQKKFNENKIIYMKSSKSIEYSMIIERRNISKEIIYTINMNNKILDTKMHKGEKYLIILDDKMQINIYNVIYKNNIGIIDLSGQVHYAYNFDIDISGLYLSLLCQLKGNSNDKSDVVLFEVGTGNVHSFISGINNITQTKFDYTGRYLIISGIEGEVTLLGLDKDVTISINHVVQKMEKNSQFLEDYSILFSDNQEEFHSNNYGRTLNNKYKTKLENNKQSEINKRESIINSKIRQNENDNINFAKKLNYIKINNNTLNNKNNEYSYSNESNKKKIQRTNNFNTSLNKTFNLKNPIFKNVRSSTPIFYPKLFNSNDINTFNSIDSRKSNPIIANSKFNFNYMINRFSNIPKLSYINIVKNEYNDFFNNNNKNRLFKYDKMKFNSYSKRSKDMQIRNINNAINQLMNDENKEKPKKVKGEKKIENLNINNFSNNFLNNNLSSFYSNETDLKNKTNINSNNNNNNDNLSKDIIIINNKRVNESDLNNKNISDSINSTFLIYHKDSHKKYPEPKDIDDIENCYYINNKISNLIK